MSQPPEANPAARRRRSDAERSIASILDAAIDVFGEKPGASMTEVAEHAGTTRQTVYAHFPNRESLLDAVRRRSIDEAAAAIDAAQIDVGPPSDALDRLIEAGWLTLARHSRMPEPGYESLGSEAMFELHGPILGRLEELIRRGQASGDFDDGPPVDWLLAAFLALIHAAAAELAAERLDSAMAVTEVKRSVRRILEVPGA